MSTVIGDACTSAEQLAEALYANGFPVQHLRAHPVSALESMATEVRGELKGVCPVRCLACCADAIHPGDVIGKVNVLTPRLLGGILALLERFVRRGDHILSTGRLNLFSGSNELDNPNCVDLRELLSAFLEREYGIALGVTSSDIVFHISRSATFRKNLLAILGRPMLWDNLCFSLDEQIPMRTREEYEVYLDHVAWVWKALVPALTRQLDHAKPARSGQTRVILNLLIPKDLSGYEPAHAALYPGGPLRATSFQELVRRYVQPYVGNLEQTVESIPEGHVFTTALGRLAGVNGSSVYLAMTRYMLTGRARSLVRPQTEPEQILATAIRTKIMPVGDSRFRVKGCLSTGPESEDEVTLSPEETPPWFEKLSDFVVDVGSLEKTA